MTLEAVSQHVRVLERFWEGQLASLDRWLASAPEKD